MLVFLLVLELELDGDVILFGMVMIRDSNELIVGVMVMV